MACYGAPASRPATLNQLRFGSIDPVFDPMEEYPERNISASDPLSNDSWVKIETHLWKSLLSIHFQQLPLLTQKFKGITWPRGPDSCHTFKFPGPGKLNIIYGSFQKI